ncbi:TetR/AcrR family transcriptional regulator [Microbacterium awajiense]|uniref:TetR/AcrR family transcriptional regulator n=1 Tax=Microbacterium awajiense TaxID=415214 RepID=A0ABP7AU38_9MICO
MAQRGSYAKGVAKREEILTTALEVIAREGFRGASVKELADAVGLSQAGLLHYFDSKEELFAEILRKRDEVDSAAFGDVSDPSEITLADLERGYVQVVRHNADVAGLVQLFARLSVDAAEPQHPAHEYFIERGRTLRRMITGAVAQAQADGSVSDRVDADTIARLFQAVADGLQVQWMLEPDIDMAAAVEALFELVFAKEHDTDAAS